MKFFTRFSDFTSKYMQSISVRVDKTTFAGYNSYLRNHILPYFGDEFLWQISSEDLQNFVYYLVECGLSPKTIKNVFSLLRSILTRAVKWGYIKKSPAEIVDLPPLNQIEVDYYNRRELLKLINALEKLQIHELKYKVAVEFAFLMGYRKSEICGLDWSQIDLKGGTSRIIQKRIIVDGLGVIKGHPKTKKSKRLSVIPEPLLSDLKILHKSACGIAVIAAEDGSPIYPQVLARWFVRFLKNNNLRHISLHKLRHSYASLLAHLDVGLTVASDQLGHAQKTTTLNIYTHLFEDLRYDVAKKITRELYKK